MNKTESCVTLKLGIDDYSYCIEVVYLIKRLVLRIHLSVKAVYRFNSTLKIKVDVVFGKLVRENLFCFLNEVSATAKLLFNLKIYLIVTYSVKVVKADILKLLLNTLNTKTMCQWRINIHGFKGDSTLPVLFFCRKSTHIVQSITEFNENNTNIPVHCKKHLTDILNMRLFLVGNLYLNYLGKTVNKNCNVLTEHFCNRFKIRFISTILNGVVKKRGTDGIGIKT